MRSTVFPYAAITSICTIVSLKSSRIREVDSVKFTDKNGQVRIVLLKDAILYIKADENYIIIYYKDGEVVKDYTLRSSMSAITPLATRFGLFRCQRSYFVNPTHIIALRKDANDMYSAELDVPGHVIPVSRNRYSELSRLL